MHPPLARSEIGEATDQDGWERTTRELIMRTFADQVYGHPPDEQVELSSRVLAERPLADGSIRRQLALTLYGPAAEITITLLAHLPATRRPAATFLGLNFLGNHACTVEEDVLVAGDDARAPTGAIHYDGLRERHRVLPARGAESGRWRMSMITSRGYTVITWSYLQCGPDHAGIFGRGLNRLFADERADRRPPGRWGSIGIWAWSLSRVLDALEAGAVPEVDAGRVVAVGHSRLGKTALWSAAQDRRFAAAISNDSGAMGATLSRPVGETPEVLARVRPHWFAPEFERTVLAGRPLPVDQHQLLSCVAPRPLYVASASDDHNADPEGEFLSWRRAARTWRLYGHEPVEAAFPQPGGRITPDGLPLGYHLRRGPHDVTDFDWACWLDFADRWLR